MKVKSPFYVVQDFLSAKLCEQFVDDLELYEPDYNDDDKPVLTTRQNEKLETHLFNKMQELMPKLEEYYNFEYKGMEHINFEWGAEGFEGSNPICENSNYLRKKWVQTKNRDFTAILFFSNYQEKLPFDTEFECYGGKSEFPQHRFSFQPQRGTLIVFPSGPHFIHSTGAVLAGELFKAKIQIAAKDNFIYQPEDFPGDFAEWFIEFP